MTARAPLVVGSAGILQQLQAADTLALPGPIAGTSGAFSGSFQAAQLYSTGATIATALVQVRGDGGNSSATVQFTNNAGSAQWAAFSAGPSGIIAASGGMTFGGPLTPARDNVYALGSAAARFQTIYAAGANLSGLQTFASDSAAGTGGLVSGDIYKTGSGLLAVKA